MRKYKKLYLLKEQKNKKTISVRKFTDEFGVKYLDLNDICNKYLKLKLTEILYFKRKLSYIKEFKTAFEYGDYQGNGIHVIKEEIAPQFIKKLCKSEFFSESLNEKLNELLESNSYEEKHMDLLDLIGENSLVYLKDYEPRVNIKTLSFMYEFEEEYLKQICIQMIIKKGYTNGFFDEKDEELTLEGFVLLLNAVPFQNELSREVLKAFKRVNDLLRSSVYFKILTK